MDLDKRIEILTLTAAILAASANGSGVQCNTAAEYIVDQAAMLLKAAEQKVWQLNRANDRPRS